MKRSVSLLLAISSILLAGMAAGANRPHYGGTLRIASTSAPLSLDPLQQSNTVFATNLIRLLFDTLVVQDDHGALIPSLGSSWTVEPGNQRWQISVRQNVTFPDGSPLTPDVIATSLRAANPRWKIFPNSDSITIETDAPTPNLPAQLALPKNAIAKRSTPLLGTGPFAVAEWQPGKSLLVRAREDYWGARPFLDSVQISLGRNLREQMIAFELGKCDLIEVPPEQAHRAGKQNGQIVASQPVELFALVFQDTAQDIDQERLRKSLALSIDRSSINNVLLQGAGIISGGLLPQWMSGYSFLFPTEADLPQARQIRNQVRETREWTFGYDINDPTARVIAERIALNAKDAGIAIHVSSSAKPDLRLVRGRIASLDSSLALTLIAQDFALPSATFSGNSAEDLFAAEKSLLNSGRVIPLLHVPVASSLSSQIKNWNESPDGTWRVESAWRGAESE